MQQSFHHITSDSASHLTRLHNSATPHGTANYSEKKGDIVKCVGFHNIGGKQEGGKYKIITQVKNKRFVFFHQHLAT